MIVQDATELRCLVGSCDYKRRAFFAKAARSPQKFQQGDLMWQICNDCVQKTVNTLVIYSFHETYILDSGLMRTNCI